MTADTPPAGVRIPVRSSAATTLAGPMQEPDIDVVVELTLAQAISGATLSTEVTRTSPCADCQGSGVRRAEGACTACGGAGVHTRRSGGIAIRQVCTACEGQGHAAPVQCGACGGTGAASRPAQVTIRVPPGVQDGTRLRVPKVGAVNRGPQGLAEGDLYAVVKVAPHPLFERHGPDLCLRAPVSLAEAVLGATIQIPTIEGDRVSIRVPPGTKHGRTFRIRGRGASAGDARGDLLITIELDMPTELNAGQRAALEAFAAATDTSPRAHLLNGGTASELRPPTS